MVQYMGIVYAIRENKGKEMTGLMDVEYLYIWATFI